MLLAPIFAGLASVLPYLVSKAWGDAVITLNITGLEQPNWVLFNKTAKKVLEPYDHFLCQGRQMVHWLDKPDAPNYPAQSTWTYGQLDQYGWKMTGRKEQTMKDYPYALKSLEDLGEGEEIKDERVVRIDWVHVNSFVNRDGTHGVGYSHLFKNLDD